MTDTYFTEERRQAEDAEKMQALLMHINKDIKNAEDQVTEDEINQSQYRLCEFTQSRQGSDADWLVTTYEQAENILDDILDDYIRNQIIPGLPEAYQDYFNWEKWKLHQGDRGLWLSRHNGEEHNYKINKTVYYIHREH